MNIGEKIKNARKLLSLSQQQLGGKEFTKGYISQIEQGRVKPSLKVLTVISERLNKPISYFLDEDVTQTKELQDNFITGENLYLQKKYKESTEVFNDIVNTRIDIKSSFYCKSMLYLGKCLFFLNNYSKGIDILTTASVYIRDICLYEELADCYDYIGHCYFNLNDFKKAIAQYMMSFDLIQDKGLNMPNKKSKLFLNTGTAYSNIGNFKTAIQYFEKNIIHCQKNYIADTLLDSHVRIGYCYLRLEMYQYAKDHALKAISINKGLNFDIVNTEIYSLLGLLIAKEGKIDGGFKLLSKSMDISLKMDYEFGYNLNIVYWVSILKEANRLEEAESFAMKHLNTLHNSQNKLPLYLLYGHLGEIYLEKGNIEKGIEYLKTSIENYIKINCYWEIAYYSKLLADILIETNPSEAKHYYNLSIDYTLQTADPI